MTDEIEGKGKVPAKAADAPAETAAQSSRPSGVFLVPYPKIVFLYPTFLVSLIAMIWMLVAGKSTVGPDDAVAVCLTWTFLVVLVVNLGVITFDFPRATSLTMFFLIAALVLAAVLTFTLQPQLFPRVANMVRTIRPAANATFFSVVTASIGLLFLAVFINVRFDYWEVRPNELLHHHGMLSDLKRYSAPNLRIDKEINDVFEYLLLKSGRLIIQASGERRAIILENVPFINKKELSITQMLGALQVEVRTEPSDE